MIKNSVRHPEFILEYPFIRQSGIRSDGIFELHLGRASPLGECELHFRMNDLLEAKQVYSEYTRLLTIRRNLSQREMTSSRKRTFKNSFNKRNEPRLPRVDMNLGPELPMPCISKSDCQTDSESSLNNRVPRKRMHHQPRSERIDTGPTIGFKALASSLSERCTLTETFAQQNLHLMKTLNLCSGSQRRVTVSSTAQPSSRIPGDRCGRNMYTNLVQIVSKSMPNSTTQNVETGDSLFRISDMKHQYHSPSEPSSASIDRSLDVSTGSYQGNSCSSTCMSLEQIPSHGPGKFTPTLRLGSSVIQVHTPSSSCLSGAKISRDHHLKQHNEAENEHENTATTLIPIQEASDLGSSTESTCINNSSTLVASQAEYVDVSDIPNDSRIVLGREEILKQPPKGSGLLEMDAYTHMLADHESSMLAAKSSETTPRSSLSIMAPNSLWIPPQPNATRPLLSEKNAMPSTSNESADTVSNLAPDRNTIMWVLSYLMAMDPKKRPTDPLHTQLQSALNENIPSLMQTLKRSVVTSSMMRQKRAASFNLSDSKNIPTAPLTHHQATKKYSIPHSPDISDSKDEVIFPSKRMTVGSCSNREQLINTCHITRTTTTSSSPHESQMSHNSSRNLACRILEKSETERLLASVSDSRYVDGRRSSNLSIQRPEATSGNRANDDLFATVSFNPKHGHPEAKNDAEFDELPARTLSDAIIYRPKQTITKQSIFGERKSLSTSKRDPPLGRQRPSIEDTISSVKHAKSKTKSHVSAVIKSKLMRRSVDAPQASASTSARTSLCSSSYTAEDKSLAPTSPSEAFYELLGPASIHYGLTKHQESVGDGFLPQPSLYDDISPVHEDSDRTRELMNLLSSQSRAPFC